MLARVNSCAIVGLDGVIVEVEVDSSQGLPVIIIVGLPDAAVKESKDRVQSAIKNSQLQMPRKRVTVNLAPADVRKFGPIYDLPIALGILIASKQLDSAALENSMIVGELSLDGSVRHVRGVLPMAALARDHGIRRVFVPADDAAEASYIPEVEVFPVQSLAQLYSHFLGIENIAPLDTVRPTRLEPVIASDFADIKGQEHVKRALEVAAAGGHNCLMVGPPGSGKTLLARSLPGIMPPLSIDEALDVTRIYSIADQLQDGSPLIQNRPFRSPHHTISNAGLVGGGNWPQPGEISLAHRGVLFLDEMPEFGLRVLEVLRQPLEDKVVTISRAQGSSTFPANFQLIGAMNPCPCGFYGDPHKDCTCAFGHILRYQNRLSGPLLDRIDIHVQVPRVDYEKLSDERRGEPSVIIRDRVSKARELQLERFKDQSRIQCNADMGPSEVQRYCQLDDTGKNLIRSAMTQMQLSARAYHRILKLALTIADLNGSTGISPQHLAEALQYRPRTLQG